MINPKYVICIKNKNYETSLELKKVYRLVRDSEASTHGRVRVVDESGEDYLYPASYFAPINIPQVAKKVFVRA